MDFALTLNFYSTKAYNYVRDKFNYSLPHPATLCKWQRESADAEPSLPQDQEDGQKLEDVYDEVDVYNVVDES